MPEMKPITFTITLVIAPVEQPLLINGEHYTVLEWVNRKDNSYKGTVLELKSVDFPYAVFERKTDKFSHNNTLSIDLREVKLKSLTKEYVDAATHKS